MIKRAMGWGAAAAVLVAAFAATASAGETGGLVGVGVKSCEDLTAAARGADRGEDLGILRLRGYEDWAAGFVSGLSLAAGQDLLRNVPFDGFMRRVRLHCADNPRDDVFTAVNGVLRQLNAPEKD
jgi:hypothetical protein